MGIPAYQAAGSWVSAGSGSTLSPSWPTCLTDDVGFLCVIENFSVSDASLSSAQGFTKVGSIVFNGGFSYRLTLFVGVASSSSPTGPTVAVSSGSTHAAAIFTWRGADTAALVDAFTTNSGSSTTSVSVVGPTSTGADRIVIMFVADNSNASHSSWANASLTSVTERNDAASGLGGFGIGDGGKAAAGATGTFTCTLSASTQWGGIVVALAGRASGGTSNNLLLLGVG